MKHEKKMSEDRDLFLEMMKVYHDAIREVDEAVEKWDEKNAPHTMQAHISVMTDIGWRLNPEQYPTVTSGCCIFFDDNVCKRAQLVVTPSENYYGYAGDGDYGEDILEGFREEIRRHRDAIIKAIAGETADEARKKEITYHENAIARLKEGAQG